MKQIKKKPEVNNYQLQQIQLKERHVNVSIKYIVKNYNGVSNHCF